MLGQEPSYDLKSVGGFRALFDDFFEPLVAYSITIIKDKESAKDLVQQLFVKVWEIRATLEEQTVVPYLFVSVKNRSYNYLRNIKQREELNELHKEIRMEEYQLLKEDEDRMIKALLQAAISSLPQRCREVFVSNKVEGFNYQETADHLGISVKTVERQMNIALKKLRVYLTPHLNHILTFTILQMIPYAMFGG